MNAGTHQSLPCPPRPSSPADVQLTLDEILGRMNVAASKRELIARGAQQRGRLLSCPHCLQTADVEWLTRETGATRDLLDISLALGGGTIAGARSWLQSVFLVFVEPREETLH